MYEFMDKLIHIVMPRLREWPGMNPIREKSGVKLTLDQSAVGYFPDIEPFFDMYPNLFDVDISIYTTGRDVREDTALLSALGMPFLEETEMPKEKEDNVDPNDPFASFKKEKMMARGKKVLPPVQGSLVRRKA